MKAELEVNTESGIILPHPELVRYNALQLMDDLMTERMQAGDLTPSLEALSIEPFTPDTRQIRALRHLEQAVEGTRIGQLLKDSLAERDSRMYTRAFLMRFGDDQRDMSSAVALAVDNEAEVHTFGSDSRGYWFDLDFMAAANPQSPITEGYPEMTPAQKLRLAVGESLPHRDERATRFQRYLTGSEIIFRRKIGYGHKDRPLLGKAQGVSTLIRWGI